VKSGERLLLLLLLQVHQFSLLRQVLFDW